MCSLLKNSLVILMLVLAFFSAVFATSINLNQQDIFVRKGFDKAWINNLPSKNDPGWFYIPGKTGSRPLVVRELGFKNLPEHSFLSFKTYPAESFTFVTSFNVADSSFVNLAPLALFLKGVGYNWEIFLNGVSIEKEIHLNKDGETVPKRGLRLFVLLPPHLIRSDKNTLTYHIIGDPTYYGTGFYYGKPCTIKPVEAFFPVSFNFFSISSFAIYFVIAVMWLYLFIRQRQHLIYLYFSLLSLAFTVYTAERAFVEISSGTFNFLSLRVEYLAVFSIAFMFVLVVNAFLKHKITFMSKVYCFFCGLFAFFCLWSPPNFILDLLRLWQVTLPLMSGYLLYLSVGCLLANRKAKRQSIALPNFWIQMPVKEITFFSFCVLILVGAVIIDALDSVFFRQGLFVNKYGFLICMVGMAVLLFNRFILASEKVEKWNEELEKEVQKKTQNLRRVKDDLEAVFSSSGNGIAKFSLNLELETYNKAYCDIFGYSEEEIKKVDIKSYYNEENLEIVLLNRKKALDTGLASFRTTAIHKNGNNIHLTITGTLMKNEDGKPSALVVNMKNITKEVDAEDELRASNENLEAVFLALPDLYFRFNHKGEFLEYHGSEDQLYNPKDNIVGSTIAERLPEGPAKIIMDALRVVVSQQKRVTVEYVLEMPEGNRVFESAMLPFRDNEVIAGVRDITDRRSAEDSLLKSNEQYRSLVENMEDIVLVIDPNQKILFVNQSLLVLNSKKTSAVLGQSISTVLAEKGTPIIAETVDRIVKSLYGEKIDVEISFSTFSSWFELEFVPQFDSSNSLYSILCIGRDTTEKILYEQGLVQHVEKLQTQRHQLRKLSKEMLNIQENERKYISMELHDEIGQSMTAINMTLQSIRTGELKDNKIKRRISDCQKLVEETSKKIHQFSLELRPPELDDLGLLPAIKSHSRKFTARTGLAVNIESDNEVEIVGSEIKTAFYRVFQEGINNIAKHANASSINVSIYKQNGNFLCYIEDDGDGFDSNRIFANTAGLGLIGMSERIKSIGGRFDIQSNSGKGTRLCVELPKNRVEK